MKPALPIQALEAFSALIPRGGQVLCLDPEAAGWLTLRGIEIQVLPMAKELRLLSLKRASYAGVWAGTALCPLSIEDAQRVIATFFQALVPQTGMLFAAHTYPSTAFASLLRQNGFQTVLEGSIELLGENTSCVVLRRI